MRCRHPHWTEWRNDRKEVALKRCNLCNAWLPLGPANDASEAVQVEIAAAGHAAGDSVFVPNVETAAEVVRLGRIIKGLDQ